MPWNIGTFRLVCFYVLQKSPCFPTILTFHLLFYQISQDREDGTGGGEDVRQLADPRQAQRARPQSPRHQPPALPPAPPPAK